ncbi:hypothetical protein FA13DRAFT_1728871, partial [Coprinellus micaceus]
MSALTIIVAATPSNGIGLAGGLPWRLPKELKYFAATSIVTASDLGEALNRLKSQGLSKPVHRAVSSLEVAQLYRETLKLPKAYVDRILLTRVFSPEFECDTFMPEFKVDSELGGAGKEEVDGWKR